MTALTARAIPAFVTRILTFPPILSPTPRQSLCKRTRTPQTFPRTPPQFTCTALQTPSTDADSLLHLAASQSGLSDPQIQSLYRLTDLLLQVNRQYNLTAIRTRDAVLVKHVIDALTLLPILDREQPKSIIDVGTGAGFPGFVLAISRPDCHITLLDSARKKTRFHDVVMDELGLQNVESVWARAEEAGQDGKHREQYDVAVARSVAEMRALAELCIPFVSLGGCFLAQKSVDEGQAEIRHATSVFKTLGGQLETISSAWPAEWKHLMSQFDGGPDGRDKSIVVIRKQKRTFAKYPRVSGTPKKDPL